MAKEGGMGERLDADLKYGQGDQRTPEQLAMADYLMGGSELALETDRDVANRERGDAQVHFVSEAEDTPKVEAEPTRAEKNAKMMAELIKQKLNAMLDGKPEEEARIAGMISLLEERMK